MPSNLDRLRNLLEQFSTDEFRSAWEVYHGEDARRRRVAALSFRAGDRVRFETDDGEVVQGVVERVNAKTVTVRADEGGSWRVAPQLLEIDPQEEEAREARTP